MTTKASRNLDELVARNIKAERLKKGITQESLARLTGFSVRFISRLETEPQNLRLDKLEVFAMALGVPAMSLLYDTDCQMISPSVAEDFCQALGLLQGISARCLG